MQQAYASTNLKSFQSLHLSTTAQAVHYMVDPSFPEAFAYFDIKEEELPLFIVWDRYCAVSCAVSCAITCAASFVLIICAHHLCITSSQ
jgi:hypothetical protein